MNKEASNVIVGTLSKKFQICKRFINSLFVTHPYFPKDNIIVIDDTGLGAEIMETNGFNQVVWLPALYPWAFSKNANLLINAALQMKMDLFLCNDDTEFLSMNAVYEMESICKLNDDVGVLSPIFLGSVGNNNQMAIKGQFESRPPVFYEDNNPLCFVAVYLPYRTLKETKFINESFNESSYGWEDNEYCDRVKETGKRMAITNKVLMRHGFRDKPSSNTYADLPGIDRMVEKGKEIYAEETARRKRLGIY